MAVITAEATSPGGCSVPLATGGTSQYAAGPATWWLWTPHRGRAARPRRGHRRCRESSSLPHQAGARRTLVSADGTGHCPSCGRTVKLRLDGKAVTHKTMDQDCPGTRQQPSEDAPLVCWLPVKDGLTPHGLRHSHKTWMAEDGIPEILAEQRLGHDVPGMRGLYAHVSKLAIHACRTHDAYVLDGEPLWGISVYCTLDDVGPASLDGLLRRFASYRAVHLPRAGQLRGAGFLSLPSFGRPHYTIRLNGDDPAGLIRLLDALGPTQARA
jgi:Phage integrase family